MQLARISLHSTPKKGGYSKPLLRARPGWGDSLQAPKCLSLRRAYGRSRRGPRLFRSENRGLQGGGPGLCDVLVLLWGISAHAYGADDLSFVEEWYPALQWCRSRESKRRHATLPNL